MASPEAAALGALKPADLNPHDRAVVAFARGLRAYRRGRWATAAQALRQAARAEGLANADMARFFWAESLFHQGLYASAGKQYRALLKAHPHSEWRHRARMRQADVDLARPGRRAQGVRALRKAIDRYPEYPHQAAAQLALGEAEQARGRLKAAATAFAQIVRWSPMDPLVALARRHLQALKALGASPKAEAPEAILKRCSVLRRRKAYAGALEGLGRLLTHPGASFGIRRAARYQIGRTLYMMELFPEAHETFAEVERISDAASWRRRAQRWRAYTLERLGRFEDAAQLLLVARGDPEAPSAETASKIAWLYFNGAQYEQAAAWFDRVAGFGGRWARETRFWRVWMAYRMGQFEAALSGFKALQARSKWRPERYGYWVGRTLANVGEIDAAADTWRGIIASAPLSYYAYQARARLLELGQTIEPEPDTAADPEADDGPDDGQGGDTDCEAGEDGCAAAPRPTEPPPAGIADHDPEGDEPAPELAVSGAAGRPELDALAQLATRYGAALPGLVAAYELAALGEHPQAALRLRAVRDEWLAYRRASRGQRRRWAYVHSPFVDYRKDREVVMWGVERDAEAGRPLSKARRALFKQRIGQARWSLFTQAFMDVGDHHYVRRHIGRKNRALVSPPETPANNPNWRRWYPLAFERTVRHHAAAHGLEPAFIWALMNVESSYNPWAISRVGARGLMQVMPHTGALVADRMGRGNFGTALLIEPEVAIEQAAWYFEQLLTKFQGQLPLAIAGYNAGPHRVASWLLNKGHLPMDEFIEEIPYTEAREYAKKVLRYLALYRRIYEGDARLKVSQIIDPDFRNNINF